MRYKFSFATRHARANKLIQYVQNSLAELAIAFGSSFTIKETGFSDISFKDKDSASLIIGDKNDMQELSGKLELFAQVQSYSGAANISLLKSELLAKELCFIRSIQAMKSSRLLQALYRRKKICLKI